VRRRLALSAFAVMFTTVIAIGGNATTASADSSAPAPAVVQSTATWLWPS
jgi:hypothetical protein